MPYIIGDRYAVTWVSEGGLVTITADSNQTWTIAQFSTGYIQRTLVSTARSDTTPTAAAIVQQFSGAAAGTYFPLYVLRTDAGGVNLTVVGGSGVTVTGTATVAANSVRTFLVVLVTVTRGSEAVTMYSLGTAST